MNPSLDNLIRALGFGISGFLVWLFFVQRGGESEWLGVLPAMALLAAVLAIAMPIYRRREREARAKGGELIRVESTGAIPFLDADEQTDIYRLEGCHSSVKKEKAFGVAFRDMAGSLYLTGKRIAYAVPDEPNPVLSVPLDRVNAVWNGSLFSRHPIGLRFVDETGRERTWRFGTTESPGVEQGIKRAAWIELAQKLVDSAKSR